MKFVLYLTVGILLALANIWYFKCAYRALFDKAIPSVISPFQYVGVEDKDAVKGQAMARLLAARLASLQYELNEAETALLDATPPPATRLPGSLIPPEVDRIRPLEIDAKVIDVPALDVKVSGVELSGLFNWAYRSLAESRAIKVTIHSPPNALKHAVAADLDTPDIGTIWITDLEPNDLDAIQQVAIDILRQHVLRTNRFQEAAGLDRKEFTSLISALRKSGNLNRRLRLGVAPAQAEYREVVTELEPLIARTPRWKVLIELAANAAENDRQLEKAIVWRKQLRDLFDEGKDLATLSADDAAARKAMSDHIAKLEATLLAAAPLAVATADAASVGYPLNMVDVPLHAAIAGQAKVAVLGGTPLQGQLKSLGTSYKIIPGGKTETDDSKELREHTGAAASLVRAIAPNATLLFTSTSSSHGGVATSELMAALDRLLQEAPDVLLIPLGPLDNDSTWTFVLERTAGQTVVVLPAGNQGPTKPPQFGNSPLAGRILIADAVDDKGRFADFASKQKDNVVWAPGVNIPVAVVDDNDRQILQTQNGSSYSAALAAGIAARLKAAQPNLNPAEIIQRLRSTSKPLVTGGPPVLRLNAALDPTPPASTPNASTPTAPAISETEPGDAPPDESATDDAAPGEPAE